MKVLGKYHKGFVNKRIDRYHIDLMYRKSVCYKLVKFPIHLLLFGEHGFSQYPNRENKGIGVALPLIAIYSWNLGIINGMLIISEIAKVL